MSLRAVIWCAVSTKAQIDDDKDSLPNQEKDARELCQRNGWQINAVLRIPGHSRRYVDIHECARDMAEQGIDAFNRLIELWTVRGFDVLVCRDGDRFARTQTLHSYVVERTIEMGARIYSLSDGWVDDKNYRMWIAMSGYKAASSVDFLVNAHRAAMDSAARRGLPTGWAAIFSHKIIRNESGRRIGLAVDESKRRLFSDLATLILEGISWSNIEDLMYSRYGHVNPDTGRPYGARTMYKLVYNLYFWGNSGRHYDGKYGNWAFDPDEPAPDGVDVYYGTHQAVWTGDQAERIKAELRRRGGLRGRADPNATNRFTGLLVCASCGASLGIYKHCRPRNDGSHYTAWMCYTRWTHSRTRPHCNQNRVIQDRKVMRYVDSLLRQLLAANDADFITAANGETPDRAPRLHALRQEIAETEALIGEMIIQQAKAPANIQKIYTDKISEASQRLDILRHNLAQLQRTAESPSVMAARQQSFSDLVEIGIDGFWRQDKTRINQMLHRLFGKRRLIVNQGEIIGLGPATQWW